MSLLSIALVVECYQTVVCSIVLVVVQNLLLRRKKEAPHLPTTVLLSYDHDLSIQFIKDKGRLKRHSWCRSRITWCNVHEYVCISTSAVTYFIRHCSFPLKCTVKKPTSTIVDVFLVNSVATNYGWRWP